MGRTMGRGFALLQRGTSLRSPHPFAPRHPAPDPPSGRRPSDQSALGRRKDRDSLTAKAAGTMWRLTALVLAAGLLIVGLSPLSAESPTRGGTMQCAHDRAPPTS